MRKTWESTPEDLSLVLCGEAGQGIKTVELVLAQALKQAGYHVFAASEFMSRIRGGSNSTEIRVSSRRRGAPVRRIDLCIPFHEEALNHLAGRLSGETVIIGDSRNICRDCPVDVSRIVDVPFVEIAAGVGGPLFLNMVAVGVVMGLFALDPGEMAAHLERYFIGKTRKVIENNIAAVNKGYPEGTKLRKTGRLILPAPSGESGENDVLCSGSEAVGLGALAGGCTFLASYPMSPSTGVMIFLAGQTGRHDLIVEQAEDEISAVNMALGASYAGARSLVTTSGGGFALMSEGISLAGMIETPVVVHVAQRPGPATGLPTRTEQGDLELVLYAGHGEFPRIILAPGDMEEAFSLTAESFNLADKYQVPVFILTDQLLMDATADVPAFDMDGTTVERHVIRTEPGYRRFALTESGLSPRGIPGFGNGLVGVDSDEHDEEAHITENLSLRIRMVDKRLRKYRLIEKELFPPSFFGNEDYRILVLCWGSTLHAVKEALEQSESADIGCLHFKQVHPLPENLKEYLERAEKILVVESNATSQFGRLVALRTGRAVDHAVLKYNGEAFTVEEVIEGIAKALNGEKPHE